MYQAGVQGRHRFRTQLAGFQAVLADSNWNVPGWAITIDSKEVYVAALDRIKHPF